MSGRVSTVAKQEPGFESFDGSAPISNMETEDIWGKEAPASPPEAPFTIAPLWEGISTLGAIDYSQAQEGGFAKNPPDSAISKENKPKGGVNSLLKSKIFTEEEFASSLRRAGASDDDIRKECLSAFGEAAAPPERELWANRTTGRKVNPVAFIRQVYGDTEGRVTISRSELVHIDYPLSAAYARWIDPKRHPEDAIWPEDGKRRISKIPDDEFADHKRRQSAQSQTNRRNRLLGIM